MRVIGRSEKCPAGCAISTTEGTEKHSGKSLCSPWLIEFLQQLHRVHRTLRCFLMLEVSKHVSSRSEVAANSFNHGLPLLRCIARLAITVIREVGGGHIRRNSFFGLGHAKCPVVFLQKFVNFVGEPGNMAELERGRNSPRQATQKFLQKRNVHFQVRRQLKKQRTQFLCTGQRFHSTQKSRQKILGLLQTLDVCDHLVRFYAEAKAVGSLVDPLLRRRLLQ